MRISIILLLVISSTLWFCTGSKLSKGYSKPEFMDDQTYKLTEVSTDQTYGFIVENPVIIGDKTANAAETQKIEQYYLNALTGPGGEKVFYSRAGSCCAFKTRNSVISKTGLLRKYRVTWEGRPDTITLFLNTYDYAKLQAPAGFGFKQ